MDNKEVKEVKDHVDTAVSFLKAHNIKWQFIAIVVIIVIVVGYDIVTGMGAG